jgi:hypothetical protein
MRTPLLDSGFRPLAGPGMTARREWMHGSYTSLRVTSSNRSSTFTFFVIICCFSE